MPLVFILPVAKRSEYRSPCFLGYYTYWPNNNNHCPTKLQYELLN